MALTQQTLRRLPHIKEGLLKGATYDTIAQNLGVGHRTIDRDIQNWVNSGNFESWIKEEWLRLHNIILHEDPTEAYRNITKLVSHMLTRKIEHHEEVYEEIKLVIDACPNNSPSQANTTPTLDKENSTEATQDSASSAAAEDGAKPKAEPTKQSSAPCNPPQNP